VVAEGGSGRGRTRNTKRFNFSKRGIKGVSESEIFEVEVGGRRRRRKKCGGFSKRRHLGVTEQHEGGFIVKTKPNTTGQM